VLPRREGDQPRFFVVRMHTNVEHVADHPQTAEPVEQLVEPSGGGLTLAQPASPACVIQSQTSMSAKSWCLDHP
jgi:hypothetical protein